MSATHLRIPSSQMASRACLKSATERTGLRIMQRAFAPILPLILSGCLSLTEEAHSRRHPPSRQVSFLELLWGSYCAFALRLEASGRMMDEGAVPISEPTEHGP